MNYLIGITEAKYLRDYKIQITFNTGEQRIVDLKDQLYGEMFESLKNKNIFMQFRVDKDIRTIVWPNGADLAPYSLYELSKPITKAVAKHSSKNVKVK
ncbi:MAG: DUF2442 domain-containing protein [Ignavibacteriaceae bacterium]